MNQLFTTIDNLTKFLTSTMLPFLQALAVCFFMYGLVKFIKNADDERAKQEGKNLMVWGMIALFVLVAFWGIVAYIQSSLGFGNSGNLGKMPHLPTGTIPTPGQ
jgi:uncharacterized membrane protein YidH (DUF202 family)